MTPSIIIAALRAAGFRRGSKCWRDYESAKRVLAGCGLMPGEYQEAVEVVAEYVGVKCLTFA